jgi:hypothetical protein
MWVFAAQRHAAAKLGAGQVQQVAQRPQQRHLRIGIDGPLLPVNGERVSSHLDFDGGEPAKLALNP